MTLLFLQPYLIAADPPADSGGALYRREEVFEFAEPVACRKLDGGGFEITFASKGACDATVGILNAEGRIVRHLASGVLGPNAPEPLKKDSLKQQLLWDGKDDFGKDVAAPETCRVRVSLGLKPSFDKVLLGHPHRLVRFPFGVSCDKDGVYVLAGEPSSSGRFILKFDHSGKYLSTVFPVPKEHAVRAGTQAAANEDEEQDSTSPARLALPGRSFEHAAFCVLNGHLTGVLTERFLKLQFMRLKPDGSKPEKGYVSGTGDKRPGEGPCWIAASPDGRWLYLSGLGAHEDARGYYRHFRPAPARAHQGVYRLPATLDAKLGEPFLGKKAEAGSEHGRFNTPCGIACDAQGRVWVADFGNNRVQVFTENGEFVEALAVAAPRHVAVHSKSGSVYVLSCPMDQSIYSLLKFKDAKAVNPAAEVKFDVPKNVLKPGIVLLPVLALDDHAGEPTLWVSGPTGNLQLWVDKGESFELKRDLFQDLISEAPGQVLENVVKTYAGPSNLRPGGRPIVDPLRPYVYLSQPGSLRPYGAYGDTGLGVRIHTETGKLEATRPVYALGYDGWGYWRNPAYGNKNLVERIEVDKWKTSVYEHPDMAKEGRGDKRASFALGLDGSIAVHFGGDVNWNKEAEFFPGRLNKASGWVVRFDATGKRLTNDLLPGVPLVGAGLALDPKGNIYIGLGLKKLVNGKEVEGYSVLKFPPSGGRFLFNGKAMPIPLKEPPAKPADFKANYTFEGDKGANGEMNYGDKCWAEGMLWSIGGLYPAATNHCHCSNKSSFDLDLYCRVFVPEANRHSISVVDGNGNFILRFGEYGNPDERGPGIHWSYSRFVGVNDQRIYVDDEGNRRILSLDIKYHKEGEMSLGK